MPERPRKLRHLVIAGKSGVGKTTVAVNVSAALAGYGLSVMQVGYGLAQDSTVNLHGGRKPLPVSLRGPGKGMPSPRLGFDGVICLEAGRIGTGPRSTHLADLDRVIGDHAPDFVVHDLSWESYGERLLLPFGPEGAEVYVVLSAEFPALNAANNLFRTLNGRAAARSRLRLGGIIANNLRASYAESIVGNFAVSCGCSLVSTIPHSLVVQMCEMYGRTVIEAAPHAQHAFLYRRLARTFADGKGGDLPRCLDDEELRAWGEKWGGLLHELDSGIICDGAGI